MTTTDRPWAVYARKSRIGVGATITKENQWGACTDYTQAVAPGAQVVYFFDNASGFNEEAKRPEWDDLLGRIKAGEFAGVVGWHVDRFTRIPEKGEHLWKACKANGTQLHTKLGGHQTSALAFRVQNAVAADESEIKSERQKLKQAQLAADGMPHGGQRMYGWNAKRTAIVPAEQAHVVWAVDQILGGASVKSTASGLAERGATTSTGKPWRASNLGAYLRKPALAGLRVHHGEIVGPATWPALLERSKWDAVRTLLENPERRVSKAAPRVYLLTGIARCGVCGGAMRGRSNATKGRGPGYFCEAGTGHAYRRADMVDAQVRAAVVARLAQVDATGALAQPTDADGQKRAALVEEIAQVKDRLALVGRMVVRGDFTEAQGLAAKDEAQSILADLDAQLGALAVAAERPSVVLEGLAGMANAATLFDGLSLERQRAVVALLCTVTIHPQGKGGTTYNPKLVKVAWRT